MASVVSSNQLRDNSTFASSAKIAEIISEGVQRCYFNILNKSVVFKNANKPMSNCIQIETNNNFIKNVNVLSITECEPIKAFVRVSRRGRY